MRHARPRIRDPNAKQTGDHQRGEKRLPVTTGCRAVVSSFLRDDGRSGQIEPPTRTRCRSCTTARKSPSLFSVQIKQGRRQNLAAGLSPSPQQPWAPVPGFDGDGLAVVVGFPVVGFFAEDVVFFSSILRLSTILSTSAGPLRVPASGRAARLPLPCLRYVQKQSLSRPAALPQLLTEKPSEP